MVNSLKSCCRYPKSVSIHAALIHNDLSTSEDFISFSYELPALVQTSPGFPFITLLWGFALFCFNLCFPLFFHQCVEPHGGLCVLDLMETEKEIRLLPSESKQQQMHLVCRRLTDECSPSWTFTLSISLQRSFSEGRLD